MKRCGACGEEFQNQFNFCPVDGEVLIQVREVDAVKYSPTIISDFSLAQRLIVQVSFLIERLRVGWAQFKGSPTAFVQLQFTQACAALRGGSARPYLRKAVATSVMLVGLVMVTVVLVERHAARRVQVDYDDLGQATLINPQILPAD